MVPLPKACVLVALVLIVGGKMLDLLQMRCSNDLVLSSLCSFVSNGSLPCRTTARTITDSYAWKTSCSCALYPTTPVLGVLRWCRCA
jgi:hypothetical protein